MLLVLCKFDMQIIHQQLVLTVGIIHLQIGSMTSRASPSSKMMVYSYLDYKGFYDYFDFDITCLPGVGLWLSP